jgi:hypothetical protein
MLQAVLQSVAGYIDATPLTDSWAKSLATHALDLPFGTKEDLTAIAALLD